MRARLDWLGNLKYLAARLRGPGAMAWARHRDSGLRFRVSVRDVVGRTILRRRAYEPVLTGWLLQRLGAGVPGVFVDAGANLGWFSLQAARIARVRRVVAVEPDMANHALLRTNIEANRAGDRVSPVACALGAGPGLARLHAYKGSNLGRHSLLVDHGQGGSWVPVLSLDGLLGALGLAGEPVAAIKIDVEGYEPQVLAGAASALRRCESLVVELSPGLLPGGPAGLQGLLSEIAAAGLVPAVWDGQGPVPSLAELQGLESQVTVGFARA